MKIAITPPYPVSFCLGPKKIKAPEYIYSEIIGFIVGVT